jgi:acyl-CoA synthetase (AMP-forming)/AMP-acid ligase II
VPATANLSALLANAAREFPDRPAVTWGADTVTYRELGERTIAFDRWLRSQGVGRDTRVAVYMDNRPEFLVAMFGTWRSGAALVPCNARLTGDELSFLISDSGAAVVITDELHATTARAAAGDAMVCVAGPELQAILRSQDTEIAFDPADVEADDLAWLFYTSGTTGQPKGAMLSHAILTFVTVSWLADLTPLDETDVTLHAAPLSHGAGFHALAATARASHQVIPDSTSFEPVRILDTMRTFGVTNTWMVPTQIVMLTEASPGKPNLPQLRYVVYGGAPMSPAATERALRRFGPVFVQLYGQGETPMTATMLRREDHRPELFGSAGRARPGVEVAIHDVEGARLPPEAVGEVVVRGAPVMSGYWRRPDATAEALRGGWLHTGDLGRMTEDGVLYLLDRTKDMIISGGSNVYAVEVEQVLSAHPAVGDVAVIGVPDDVWGETVVAVVVPTAGGDLDAAALEQHCRASLAGYKIPRRWVAVETLPRNAYGKVVKRDLRALLNAPV